MTDSRKAEIAILLIKEVIREKGVVLTPSFRQDMERDAKDLGIPVDEFMEFVEPIIRELVDEAFAKP